MATPKTTPLLLAAALLACASARSDPGDPPNEPSPRGPTIAARPLVVAQDYAHWPADEQAYPRFALFADGQAVWRERAGQGWRWYAARLSAAEADAVHTEIARALDGAPDYVACAPSDEHNDREHLFIHTGAALREYVVEAPNHCRAAGVAVPAGYAAALARIAGFDPPRRRNWMHLSVLPFPGQASLDAAFADLAATQQMAAHEQHCRSNAAALATCAAQGDPASPDDERCAEVARAAAEAPSCLDAATVDPVCAAAHDRGCPSLTP